jgi:hypothetical protein
MLNGELMKLNVEIKIIGIPEDVFDEKIFIIDQFIKGLGFDVYVGIGQESEEE